MTSKKPHALVLDSWAALAYLQGEPAAEKMGELVADAIERRIPLYMSVINAGEVWYILAREISAATADSAISDIRGWGVELVEADWPLAQAAADFKSRHKMSYADAFAAALAKQNRAHLVTGDREFRSLGSEVNAVWL
ncbi:MAG: type II toxin-antitoxin system VapC family toxin [Verrucomicrobia bacterium]|nr:type II toxin-antitoxin system VapC family toxin [Verrucomicrobiota bacterium]